jgi:fatty-acid desaturase
MIGLRRQIISKGGVGGDMEPAGIQVARPWEEPFWRPAQGKAWVAFYLALIHILAAVGIFLFPLPSLRILGLAILFTVLGGFGTTVCYHRALAHRSLKLNKVVEHLLVFLAMFNGSGAPISWVAYHRQHHARTDTPEDISSPKQGGFWWAHLRWLYQAGPANPQRWCPDLNRGAYRIWTYAEIPMLMLSLLYGIALGWEGFFWLGAIRLVYSLHMQCLVNSVTHLGHNEEGDSSINVWWLGPLQLSAWGENWHRNHHSYAGSARLGLRWWQTDIGWYFICALEAIGLASKVKRPKTSLPSKALVMGRQDNRDLIGL